MAFSKPSSISSKITKPKPLMGDWQLLLVGLAASPGEAIATVQVLGSDDDHPNTIEFGRILVAKNILPHWLPLLKKAAGVVTEQGGMTSHGAILARELGIPAIVGAAGATELLRTGESLLLNGETGEIYRFQGKAENRGEFSHSQLPSRLRSGGGREMVKTFFDRPIATQLMVNLSATSSITNAAALPVDGVGLVRSELILQDWGVSEPMGGVAQRSEKVTVVR